MKKSGKKADEKSSTGKPKPKNFAAHEVAQHTDGKHDQPLGGVEIAPPKPLWPSKK